MSNALPIEQAIPTGLTQAEAEYVYNMEVLGLPNRKAAQMAGMPLGSCTNPHVLQARETLKREVRGTLNITKEDVVFGIRDAIGRAQIIAEPATEIMGWKEISKLMGYDTPQKVDVNFNATVQVIQNQLKSVSDEELVKALGAGSVIDAEFYEVGRGEA